MAVTLMILMLPLLVYGIALIMAANFDLRAKRGRSLTALLSLGLTEVELVWTAVQKLITRLNPRDRPRFDRRSPLHRAAALLVSAHLALSAWQLLSTPGAAGRDFFAPDARGVLISLAASALIYVSLSVVGVGWGIRRDTRAVLQRLGLRAPTLRDCFAGLVIGTLLFAGMIAATSLLPYGATADESLARTLFVIVKDSLPAALLVAILAGTGEEIFFRGALQPIFGLCLTSLFFALIHLQYGLSPALLILFFVSLGLGLLRKRFSTSAAIIAHATYNFLPFLLIRLLPA